MDIGRAFNFPFRDPQWVKKILIGALMALIPIFGWFSLAGYGMRAMRRVVEGVDTPLPEWTDFGQLVVDGVKAFLVGLAWSIPSIVLSIIATATDNFGLRCLSTLAGLATIPLVAAAIVPVALSGNMADGLQFRQVVNRVTSNLGDYLLMIVMSFVLGLIAAAGAIACGVGLLATSAYAGIVTAHLWAQAYRRSTGASELDPAPRF